MTYTITKHYEGKNKTLTEKTGMTLEAAQFELGLNESLWRKHGGIVHERTDYTLHVEEADSSETITWQIIEEDNE